MREMPSRNCLGLFFFHMKDCIVKCIDVYFWMHFKLLHALLNCYELLWVIWPRARKKWNIYLKYIQMCTSLPKPSFVNYILKACKVFVQHQTFQRGFLVIFRVLYFLPTTLSTVNLLINDHCYCFLSKPPCLSTQTLGNGGSFPPHSTCSKYWDDVDQENSSAQLS